MFAVLCVYKIITPKWIIVFWSFPFILLSDMGVERCVNLDGLTEAQIDKKLEELAKAGEPLKTK